MPSAPVEAVVDRPQHLLVVLNAAHPLDVLVHVAIPALRLQLDMTVVPAVHGAYRRLDGSYGVAEELKLCHRPDVG